MTITLIIGPPESGKTTYVKEHYGDAALYLDCTSSEYTPEFITEFATKNPGVTIVLDDIQHSCVKGVKWGKFNLHNNWVLVGQCESEFPPFLKNLATVLYLDQ